MRVTVEPDVKSQIKSRERVMDLAEVFTHEREVKAMLDLVPDMFTQIDTKFLEPACGDGNFLVEILARKIELIDERACGGSEHWFEFALLRCLASIYAVDINNENIIEARHRLREIVAATHALHGELDSNEFLLAADAILTSNIVVGDSLNAADEIVFIDYTPVAVESFEREPSYLEAPQLDLFFEPPQPLSTVHFTKLGNSSS